MSEYEARKEPQQEKSYREEEPRNRTEAAHFEETGEVAYYIPRD